MAISKRLRQFIRRFDSQSKFAQRFHIPRSTLRSWTHNTAPAVPEPAYLLEMAGEGNLSLNWLLLGDGSELRVRETQTAREAVLAAIAAELRATEDGDGAEHEQAWARLVTYRTKQDGFDAAFRPAIEAVRPLYRQFLQEQRVYRMTEHNFVQVYRATMMEKADKPWTEEDYRRWAQEARKLFQEAGKSLDGG